MYLRELRLGERQERLLNAHLDNPDASVDVYSTQSNLAKSAFHSHRNALAEVLANHRGDVVPGFYAAGDVVHGLDQISHAMGEGGQAATTIRNDLAKQQPMLRDAVIPEQQLETAETGS